MSTRIKYNYEGPIGISRQSFKVDGKQLRIVINKDEFKYDIVDSDGNTVDSGGDTKNYNVLLRQAKRALTKLGYDFHVETRNRDYGVVKKETQREGLENNQVVSAE